MTVEADVRVARRKLFIRLGQKHHRPGLGSSRTFLTRRTADMIWPDLTGVLDSVPYAVVGGVATRLYMPERLTKDLADIERMISQADDEGVDDLRRTFGHHAPDELDDLNSLIELARLDRGS